MRIPYSLYLLLGKVPLGLTGCIDHNFIQGSDENSTNFSSNFASKHEGFLKIIRSDVYGGKLKIFLDSESALRQLQETLSKYPDTKISRSPLGGDHWYYVEVKDQREAEELQKKLMREDWGKLVYPQQIFFSPQAADGTPNLEGLQTYLDGPERAGVNIRAAWEQEGDEEERTYGAGVMLAVDDNGIHYEHEEFNLSRDGVLIGGNNWGEDCTARTVNDPGFFCTESNLAHGTATVGVLHARYGENGNHHGVMGMVPNAWVTVGGWDFGAMPRGSVMLYECANQFSWDGEVTCQEGHAGLGCIGCLFDPEGYDFMRRVLNEWDMIVVGTSGNGAINLDATPLIDDATLREICGGERDDPQAADCWEARGAIHVGAHQGERGMIDGSPVREQFSNYGSQVTQSALGRGVVSTTWHPEGRAVENYDWIENPNGPNPPNDDPNRAYTNQYGGTSAGAAIIAGAVTEVQSHFKSIAGGIPSPLFGDWTTTRYLTSRKMQEILLQSSMEVVDQDGRVIGHQTDVAVALQLTREFWNNISAQFPRLTRNEELTEDQTSRLHQLGVGLDRGDPSNPYVEAHIPCERETNDFRCLERDIVPHLAKKMDIDEDGRGDLISWHPGEWRIDLSSIGEGGDNYGAWDVVLNYPVEGKWEVPVVDDYDSDGRADLSLYDREHGRWLIATTRDDTLLGQWHGWDHVVNWPAQGDSQNWEDEHYTRPLPADYNNDGWVDLAVQISKVKDGENKGEWKINFNSRQDDSWSNVGRRITEYGPLTPDYQNNDVGRWIGNGIWDLAYLTPEELDAYPGWAYLPSVANDDFNNRDLFWRTPKGELYSLTQGGQFKLNFSEYFGYDDIGGVEDLFLSGNFEDADFAIKRPIGVWMYYSNSLNQLISAPNPNVNGMFGGSECKTMVADLDGDEITDRIVQCPNEWRVAYSANNFYVQNDIRGIRKVPLTYEDPQTLPGQPVFGGLSFDRILQVRQFLQDSEATEAPPFFDFAMHPYPFCNLPWHAKDMPKECR